MNTKGDFFMARHMVEISGVNTADMKVLSSEETEKLFIQMREGDPFARDSLIQGNLKLVLSTLRQFHYRDENMDDLFQIGTFGLIKAIDNFDLSHGVKLSTYAVPMILGEIRRYLRDNNSIRVSRSIKDLAYNAMKEKERITLEQGREATVEEIAESLNENPAAIVTAFDSMRSPVSIFEPIYNDGGDTIYLFDQIADKKELKQDNDMLISLRHAINKIKERERNVLVSRFIIGKTQMEIAESLGISQAQVSRIEKNAINNIKRLIK